jgi:hypothetical protein
MKRPVIWQIGAAVSETPTVSVFTAEEVVRRLHASHSRLASVAKGKCGLTEESRAFGDRSVAGSMFLSKQAYNKQISDRSGCKYPTRSRLRRQCSFCL